MNKYNLYGILIMAAAGSLTSCDWDEPEAVGNHFGNISEVNPPAYTEYLKNLRSYRENGHKKVYAWFDNKESFSSQADHVATVPDSIDVLVLNHPEIMTQAVLNEIDAKRSDTGMQTAYAISYPAIRKEWELAKELGSDTPWATYRDNELKKQLAYFDGGGFDRIICVYDGRDTSTSTEAELKEYAEDQAAFLTPFKTWAASHLDKGYDFQGVPVNVTDKEFLAGAGTVFLAESLKASNLSEMKFIIMRNSISGMPVEKFAVMTSLPVLDPANADLGYWGADYSSWLTARWARTADVCAIGLMNLSDDYYHPEFIYPVCRGAIQMLNPAAK
ncbi:MAG: hypothetical protein K2L91_00300 [Duncaniella sp.]|nr:hypothetical protein [Duncaniella sp.]